jgi:hypothetical protein
MTNGGSESLDRIKISNSVWKKDAQLATNPTTAKANLRQNKNTKQSKAIEKPPTKHTRSKPHKLF